MEGNSDDHFLILSGLVLSVVVAYTAFVANWITLDATKSVMVLGTITLGFGGWWISLAMIFFFISSAFLTRNKQSKGVMDSEKKGIHHDLQKRRDGIQVWANGFWVALFLTGWFLTSWHAFMVASFAVIATAAADTWATELGTLNPGKTWLISSFKPVEPGTDGAISFKGTIAALSGSFAIAVFILLMNEFHYSIAILVFIAGFLGSIIDSYAGAFLQTGKFSTIKTGGFAAKPGTIKNSLVNWLSTGSGGLLALLISKILFV